MLQWIKNIVCIFFPTNYGKSFILFCRMQWWCNEHKLMRCAKILHQIIHYRFGCYIGWEAHIPNSVRFIHPNGIVIANEVKMGEHCVILQQVTIGAEEFDNFKYPTIGNNVKIYAHACIVGDVKVCDDVVIAAGAVVVHNITEPGVYAGVPAKLVKQFNQGVQT
jgi:serine O-acetyltransferase